MAHKYSLNNEKEWASLGVRVDFRDLNCTCPERWFSHSSAEDALMPPLAMVPCHSWGVAATSSSLPSRTACEPTRSLLQQQT
jgi:hypothetical protein